MSETIGIQFPDISGDTSGHTAFVRSQADGTLLNGSGDTITETGATGFWSFTLAETRVAGSHYFVRIYAGTTETAVDIVYDGILYAGNTLVDEPWNPTQIRGTVGVATSPSTTSFTPSALDPPGNDEDQFQGAILVWDNDTITAGLRGQRTDITASSAAALPLLTYTALTTAPASGDTFSIL